MWQLQKYVAISTIAGDPNYWIRIYLKYNYEVQLLINNSKIQDIVQINM